MAPLKLELATSYLLNASRVGAWAVVSALVFRWDGPGGFEHVSVARSAATLVAYLGLAMSPVLLRELLRALPRPVLPLEGSEGRTLAYAPRVWSPEAAAAGGAATVTMLAVGLPVVGAAVLTGWVAVGGRASTFALCLMLAAGMLARATGEVVATVLQARGKLWWDQLTQAATEWAWPALTVAAWLGFRPPGSSAAEMAALGFLLAALTSLLVRVLLAHRVGPRLPTGRPTRAAFKLIAGGVSLLLVAHLADFCYAPTVQLLLALDGPGSVAAYAPALQVDAALLLLTAAVSTVLLPRMTAALATGDLASVRRDYLRGTLACLALLTTAAVPVAIFAGKLLTAWLGPGVPTSAPAVLTFVLVHTVIGGASGVGRAVILAAGRYRTLALTSIAFGLAHAGAASFVLLHTDWGVGGVVVATITLVTLRCVVWMPWYILRFLTPPTPTPTPTPTPSPPPNHP